MMLNMLVLLLPNKLIEMRKMEAVIFRARLTILRLPSSASGALRTQVTEREVRGWHMS